MSVRRIARQGLLLVEQGASPVASTSALPAPAHACPGCLPRRFSSSISISAATEAKAEQSGKSSSWATLSRVGHAIFAPAGGKSASPAAEGARAAKLSPDALALVDELKLSRPEPHRVWLLFSQIELQGLAHTLPLVALHETLEAIHLRPAKKHLDVDSSTNKALTYKSKADLICKRIVQAGGTVGLSDYRAMLVQYAAFNYAPGVCDMWDAVVDARPGVLPPHSVGKQTFEALVHWVQLHAKSGGKELAQAAAQPLVLRAAAMLQQMKGDKKRTDLVLESFFKIVIAAKDFNVFAVAFRAVYGFDVRLPGAEVDATTEAVAARRKMGEQEVVWVLEMLAEVKDLSAMVAVFEVFDNPAPNPSPVDTFFVPSFAAPARAEAEGASALSTVPEPHVVGTRAFHMMIRSASWLGNGALARHYFNQLYWRWAIQTDQRLCAIEAAVGISPDQTANLAPVLNGEPAFPTDRKYTPPKDDAPAPDAEPVAPREQLVPALVARLTPPAALRPYAVPSTLVRDVSHFAFANYDGPTARFIRRRTLHILRLMRDTTDRITAVMDRLEPLLADSAPVNDEQADATPASLAMLEREIAFTSFHRLQLRYLFDVVKSDTGVVLAYQHLQRVHITHVKRLKALQLAIQKKAGVKERRVAAEAKERQVLQARLELVKQRLGRLFRLGRAHQGRTEFDKWNAELIRLKGVMSGKGIKVEEDEGEAAEGAEEAKQAVV